MWCRCARVVVRLRPTVVDSGRVVGEGGRTHVLLVMAQRLLHGRDRVQHALRAVLRQRREVGPRGMKVEAVDQTGVAIAVHHRTIGYC